MSPLRRRVILEYLLSVFIYFQTKSSLEPIKHECLFQTVGSLFKGVRFGRKQVRKFNNIEKLKPVQKTYEIISDSVLS